MLAYVAFRVEVPLLVAINLRMGQGALKNVVEKSLVLGRNLYSLVFVVLGVLDLVFSCKHQLVLVPPVQVA